VVKPFDYLVREKRASATAIPVSGAKIPHGVSYAPHPSPFLPRASHLQAAYPREILEVVCDEHGIGGGEYCGDNDSHLGRINVLYHESSGGKYVPRVVFFALKPGVIEAATLRRFSASSSARETS
jgi:hypothetical protein